MTFTEKFNDWMIKLTKDEEPTNDIIAFNFGLFETENGYTIYVIGSKSFDEEDADWAIEMDYEPTDNYLEINPEETKGMDWNEILEKVKLTIDQFISSNNYETSFMKNAKAITTGFDDGDLLRVK